jgi:hypothetical protein
MGTRNGNTDVEVVTLRRDPGKREVIKNELRGERPTVSDEELHEALVKLLYYGFYEVSGDERFRP